MTTDLGAQDLTALLDSARQDYSELAGRGLKLDLTRGKPAADQLDLADELLTLPGAATFKAADGTDTRNYGGLNGLQELREIFAPVLQVPVAQLLAAGNSSLELMHDAFVQALLSKLPGAQERWVDQGPIKFLAPVPGYDRHFSICERFGIEMIPVPLTESGPDMEVVTRLVAEDASIKGIWAIPKYSNPTGTVYSDETVRQLAEMPTAAPDFRIFWDNAYAVHHLTDERVEIADLLGLATAAGHADRVFVFGSTSKITFAGAGVGFFGASEANIKWWLSNLGKRSIGPDKINQLRHATFLGDAEGVFAHMEKHRALIGPKFDATLRILGEQLGGTGLATWTEPKGGYFITLTVPEGCATDVVARAAEIGVVLTPAGATHPLGQDPADSVIRIAPTFPTQEDLEAAVHALATCVKLVGYEQRLKQQ
ncbi:aminotransferase class I/II-fold pyridoxal phosphate-dependent enzyme [Kineosporia sp. J2-2]|uniref:Aminotransferase class I/II-fold pyridoxal phosphate-dependent enzyme n=1 Tax=Kineosporia corallincola TaxID=2835133 RepID=A0ABS5TSK9_9ACTN|nr:aminotransferase class I/II-fold pyridoxal phosphate-dependent enzyme [Kineosporia corallincola]MBT0773770.1 aminotransferase class I/II-fold pyridoxal phosphate-dependent enzyme [Kineosporia corallincola]